MSHTPDFIRITKKAVDAKTVAATQIITTDNGGQRFVPVMVMFEIASATLLTVTCTLSVGTNATSYNDILGTTVLTGLTAVNKVLSVNLATTAVSSVAVNTAIFVNITTGVTATAATMDVHLLGFYQ
jgi:hypothetical protein